MSYEPRLPDYATMRRTMRRLSIDQGGRYIPCPNATCRGTLRSTGGEMACTACTSTSKPFPSTDR